MEVIKSEFVASEPSSETDGQSGATAPNVSVSSKATRGQRLHAGAPGGDREDKLLAALAIIIRQLRVDQGLSQRELAMVTGLNRSYLSDVEQGKVNLSLKNLGRIAFALQSETSQLFSQAERAVKDKVHTSSEDLPKQA